MTAAAAPPGSDVLSIRDLRVDYGDRTVLDGIGFDLRRGEAHCLLGVNGAGKTTLIRAVLGRVRPVSGEIRIAPGGVGLVPQDIALFPRLTVRENLSVFARLSGVRRRQIADRVAATAALTGIAGRLDELVEDLSGGWKRRVNIASAVLGRPRLLILDEPTVGVDAAARTGLHELIRTLCDDGMGILMTTHDMTEAEAVCTHALVLAQGRLVLAGEIEDLLRGEFGHRLLLLLTLGTEAGEEALRYVASLGFHTDDHWAMGLVEDESHGMSLVEQLRKVGVELDSVRLERPGLSSLYGTGARETS